MEAEANQSAHIDQLSEISTKRRSNLDHAIRLMERSIALLQLRIGECEPHYMYGPSKSPEPFAPTKILAWHGCSPCGLSTGN
eukprot:3563236-Amphidinium_carterae.2